MNWDEYFLAIAETVRHKSKDTTKIGAVIVGPHHEIRSTGFNGFPRGIDEIQHPERWERPMKYKRVVHAEMNAILNAAYNGVSLAGCTLYLIGFGPPTVPCCECTKAIIQAGIRKIVGRSYMKTPPRWVEDLEISLEMLTEAGVEFIEHKEVS